MRSTTTPARSRLSGTVTRFQWTNPHGFIELDVTQSDGAVKHFSIELTSINMMQRVGWRSNMIKAGDKVQVVMAPLLSGEPVGLGLEVVLADGKTMGLPVPNIGSFKRTTRRSNGHAARYEAGLACGCRVRTAGRRGRTSIAAQSSAPDITGSWLRQGFTVGVRPSGQQESGGRLRLRRHHHSSRPTSRNGRPGFRRFVRPMPRVQPLANNAVACLPDGMPGMMTAVFPMEILQSRGQITIIEEAYTQVRRILMDRPQKALDDIEPGFYGHSVGRWQGDTLIVDTIGVKENVRYQNVPHSREMRILERMRLVAPDTLWNEITIDDPAVLEKPWTFTFAYQRMKDYTLLEYICEDNREYADDQGRQKIRVDPAPR